MSDLYYHKRTSDPALAPLFNTYFQRLRGLYEAGVRRYRKTFPMPQWRANLDIDGENLTVELVPRSQSSFEFFTTGKPIYAGTVTQEGLTMSSIKAACVNVHVTLEGDTVIWKPKIQKAKRALDGRTISAIQRPFQVQLVDEPVDYAPPTTVVQDRPRYRKAILESWAPGTSHSGIFTTLGTQGRQSTNLKAPVGAGSNMVGALAGVRGSAGTNLTRDVQYDMPWCVSEDGEPVTYSLLNSETPALTPPATIAVDWPRANGIQTVSDPAYGKREFAIYIDSFNQVSVFPTGHTTAASGVNQTVGQKYVKTSSMSLPGWVFVPATRLKTNWSGTGSTGLADFPEYDWNVHPDGTKACAVVYAKQDVARDTGFIKGGAISGANNFYTLYAGMAKRALGSNGGTKRVFGAGLIEVAITIALTGPNAEDFTLTVTPTTRRDPASTDYCTLFAGYLSKDITGAGSRGDLCVWDVERYYRVPDDIGFWFGAFATADGKIRSCSMRDHERQWGHSSAGDVTNEIPNNYSSPPFFASGVNSANIQPYGNDYRRTLYSLKNLTTGKELRTFPGAPSGVAQGYYIPPTDTTNVSTLFGPADSVYGDNSAPYSTVLTITGGMVAVPMHSRSQFLKVDMRTLSFVMKFQVGTWEYRRINNAFPGAGQPDTAYQYITHHPAVAIWTFNTLRDTFYPSTMPNAYVQPSPYYTEPAQDSPKTRLKTLINEDFRTAHMAGNTWTLMGVGANPPGQTVNDWTSQDMQMLRLWAIWTETTSTSGPLWSLIPTGSYTIYQEPVPELTIWWGALGVFASPLGHVLTDTPKFHWAMYSDLAVNAVMFSPMTTFFVHPNGTYAYFDQTHFYNTNGLPVHTGVSGTTSGIDFTQYWDAAKVEHWIIDKVHMEFSIGKRQTSKESSFRELYNEAVDNLEVAPVTEPFQKITLADLTATVSKLGAGTISAYGLSLQVAWGGHNYQFSEDSVPRGTGNDGDGNSGTIDWSLDYIHDGVIPQLADTHITFSSCVLIEALDG